MNTASSTSPGFLCAPTRFLFFTGKGGVGKTSLSTATAIALADAGGRVLLVSTDAASNLDEMLGIRLSNQPVPVPAAPGLSVLNIDPDAAAEAYRLRVLAQLEADANDDERATVREQLSGACTTEIAAFDEFSALLAHEGNGDAHGYDHVIFDTAPTGHSLLLMDATGAYHRQMMQQYEGGEGHAKAVHIITPLMRLQDASMTHVILVTLPEVTPVSQAAALQEDLRRAKIEPWAWVINKSIAATGTTDPLLQARLVGEHRQTTRIAKGLARRTFVLPWLPEPPVGVQALGELAACQNL